MMTLVKVRDIHPLRNVVSGVFARHFAKGLIACARPGPAFVRTRPLSVPWRAQETTV
jgi:hypothetical protein